MIYEKYILIPQNPNYIISISGCIRDISFNECIPYLRKKKKFIILDGIEYEIDRLIVSAWVGFEETFQLDIDPTTAYPTYKIESITNIPGGYLINDVEFIKIPDFREFYISKSGTIYSAKRRKFIRRTTTENNYLSATITDSTGYRAPRKVHRLVYSTYGKHPIPNDMVVDHRDGNKHNPSFNNLDLITQSDNVKLNRLHLNEKYFWNYTHKWSNECIEKIVRMLINRESPKNIYVHIKEIEPLMDFKQLKSIIFRISIKNNIDISYIEPPLREWKRSGVILTNYSPAKITRKDVEYIKKSTKSNKELATLFNLTYQQIWKIRTGKVWNE